MDPDHIKLKDIKPALSGFLRDALALMDLSSVPDERVIHDVRVLMKKSRAAMKLIVSSTDDGFYKKEYGTFRDVGRILSSLRDTTVQRKILKDLRKQHRSVFADLKNDPGIELLLKKSDVKEGPAVQLKDDFERIRDMILRSSYRIRFQSISNAEPAILLKELEGSYRLAARKYLVSRNTLRPVDIHEFRKRAKDFLYQLWFFRPLNTTVIKSLEKKIDLMTQNLGKYNDLEQLVRALDYSFSADTVSAEMDELVLLIRQRQDICLSKVWPSAYKIFRPGRQLLPVLGFKILTI